MSTENLLKQLIREVRLASYAPQQIPEKTLQELKLQIKEDLNATNNRKSRSEEG